MWSEWGALEDCELKRICLWSHRWPASSNAPSMIPTLPSRPCTHSSRIRLWSDSSTTAWVAPRSLTPASTFWRCRGSGVVSGHLRMHHGGRVLRFQGGGASLRCTCKCTRGVVVQLHTMQTALACPRHVPGIARDVLCRPKTCCYFTKPSLSTPGHNSPPVPVSARLTRTCPRRAGCGRGRTTPCPQRGRPPRAPTAPPPRPADPLRSRTLSSLATVEGGVRGD